LIPLFLLHTGIHGLLWLLLLAVLAVFLAGQILPWYRGEVQSHQKTVKQIQGDNRWGGMTLLVLVIILRSWSQIGVAAFLPFILQKQMSLGSAEIVDFIFLGAGAVGTFLGGMVSDRLSKKFVILTSLVGAIPFALLLPHIHSGWLTALVLLFFGFFVLSSFAVTVVYAQMLLPRNLALASGLNIGFGVGAGGIGAMVLGAISDQHGVGVVFQILSVLPLLAAALAVFLPPDKHGKWLNRRPRGSVLS
jgi:FSR family fosmidomycin resistance protein-like MFS transporter